MGNSDRGSDRPGNRSSSRKPTMDNARPVECSDYDRAGSSNHCDDNGDTRDHGGTFCASGLIGFDASRVVFCRSDGIVLPRGVGVSFSSHGDGFYRALFDWNDCVLRFWHHCDGCSDY